MLTGTRIALERRDSGLSPRPCQIRSLSRCIQNVWAIASGKNCTCTQVHRSKMMVEQSLCSLLHSWLIHTTDWVSLQRARRNLSVNIRLTRGGRILIWLAMLRGNSGNWVWMVRWLRPWPGVVGSYEDTCLGIGRRVWKVWLCQWALGGMARTFHACCFVLTTDLYNQAAESIHILFTAIRMPRLNWNGFRSEYRPKWTDLKAIKPLETVNDSGYIWASFASRIVVHPNFGTIGSLFWFCSF